MPRYPEHSSGNHRSNQKRRRVAVMQRRMGVTYMFVFLLFVLQVTAVHSAACFTPSCPGKPSSCTCRGLQQQQQQRQTAIRRRAFVNEYVPTATRGGEKSRQEEEDALLRKKNTKKLQRRIRSLSSLFPKNSNSAPTDPDYQRRKEAWAARYTNVDGLRRTFGSNQNVVWGDLDPATARRLYKTLLPKALLELYNLTGTTEDLAPLAYAARVAAKLYARERCSLPARVFANLFDGFRQWRRYGSFDMCGMSYQQVWEKYSGQVLQECDNDNDDVQAKICLKILERSCHTNAMIDKLVLNNKNNGKQDRVQEKEILDQINDRLEQDVRLLLEGNSTAATAETAPADNKPWGVHRIRTLRTLAGMKRRLEDLKEQIRLKDNAKEEEKPWHNRVRLTQNREQKWQNRGHHLARDHLAARQ